MDIKFEPQGVKIPKEYHRMPIWKVYSGDTVAIMGKFYIGASVPVTYENSILEFSMSDQRFSNDPVWTGTWRDGIELVAPEHPGLVRIKLPDDISADLRRGSYIFSLRIADKATGVITTGLEGMIEVEYAPSSPIKDIPYRD